MGLTISFFPLLINFLSAIGVFSVIAHWGHNKEKRSSQNQHKLNYVRIPYSLHDLAKVVLLIIWQLGHYQSQLDLGVLVGLYHLLHGHGLPQWDLRFVLLDLCLLPHCL